MATTYTITTDDAERHIQMARWLDAIDGGVTTDDTIAAIWAMIEAVLFESSSVEIEDEKRANRFTSALRIYADRIDEIARQQRDDAPGAP